MSTSTIIILAVVTVVVVGGFIALYIQGNKMQEKQIEQKKAMQANAQPATMLIIDKKIMPMKDAKLPKAVMDQTPKKYQKAKLPMVKAKVGPQIMTFICDDNIFDEIPTKGEVKAMISGIYIVSVKSVRNKHKVEETTPRKKTFREKLMKQQSEYQKQLEYEMENKKTKAEEKAEKARIKKERERENKLGKF